MRWISLLFLITVIRFGFSQSAVPNQVRAENIMDRISANGGLITGDMMYGLPLAEGKKINELYLQSYWTKSIVQFYEAKKPIEGYFAKYDLRTKTVDFLVSGVIRSVEIKRIQQITFIDSINNTPKIFVNSFDYTKTNNDQFILLEKIVEGETQLLKGTNILIKRPDYNLLLDVGSRDEKVFYTYDFYVFRIGILKKAKSVKDFLINDESSVKKFKQFIKTERPSLKRESDLIKIVSFLNNSSI